MSSLHIRWPKYWSFSIGPSNEYSGLISFRIGWFDLQGTLERLLQHHNSKASVLQCSTFFMVQLSNPYMTIGKTIALDLCRQSDVSAFEYAVRFAITFLPRSKHILFYLFFLEV